MSYEILLRPPCTTRRNGNADQWNFFTTVQTTFFKWLSIESYRLVAKLGTGDIWLYINNRKQTTRQASATYNSQMAAVVSFKEQNSQRFMATQRSLSCWRRRRQNGAFSSISFRSLDQFTLAKYRRRESLPYAACVQTNRPGSVAQS